MNSPTRGLSTGQNPSWSLTFWNRVHRYRCLVQKFWWILALTVSLCLFGGAWYQITRPLTYASGAALTITVNSQDIRLGGEQAGSMQLGPEDTMQHEIPVLKGRAVQQTAVQYLHGKYPDMLAAPVTFNVQREDSILNLSAAGPNKEYTQRYLQAVVKAYMDSRRAQQAESSDASFKVMADEIEKMRTTLRADDAAIDDYQRQTGVVYSGDPNGVNATLADARQKLDKLKDEDTQLNLMTTEQGLRGGKLGAAPGTPGPQASPGSAEVSSTTEGALQQATATLVTLQSQSDFWKRDLRPKHPKMQAFARLISEQEQLISSYHAAGAKQIAERRQRVKALIDTAQKEFEAASKKALDVNQLKVRFDQLQDAKTRDQQHLDEVQKVLTLGMSSVKIATDPIRVMDPPSEAAPIPLSWTKALAVALAAGLFVGVGILALIDRMDDRMGSISDFQLHFAEHVLGQIPRDPISPDADTDLLKSDDPRHQLVESFRNLRSTLLFMPMEGERPKTLLVTSAVPNEGKSTVSTNLALVLAFAGMKTLLIDADLRRGAIHQKFDITRDPGLTDVLGHNVNWKIAIRQTKVENLHVLPRGRNVAQPSEYLLNKNTDRLLQELYPLYDFIIIDSSPVLAADDTASLAPKIDATLFVVRMSFTSAKMTRKSLEILYGRQANVPGLILNQVDTSSPEFVYYQYSEYYHTATDGDEGGEGGGGKGKTSPKPTAPVVEI